MTCSTRKLPTCLTEQIAGDLRGLSGSSAKWIRFCPARLVVQTCALMTTGAPIVFG